MYCYQPKFNINRLNYTWTLNERWVQVERYVKAQEAHGEHFVNDECKRSDQRVQVNAWWTHGEHNVSEWWVHSGNRMFQGLYKS